MRIGRGERQKQIGQVTRHEKSGLRDGKCMRAEIALINDLDLEFRILDRGRMTGGTRSLGILQQE